MIHCPETPLPIQNLVRVRSSAGGLFIREWMKKIYLSAQYAEQYFWRTKNKEEVDLVEMRMENQPRAFNIKSPTQI